jgi:hypothetical protein
VPFEFPLAKLEARDIPNDNLLKLNVLIAARALRGKSTLRDTAQPCVPGRIPQGII